MKRKQFALIFMLISLVFSQTAFAARFGGGKSRGMQRSQSTSNYNRNNNSQPQYNNAPQNHGNNGNIGNAGATAPRQGMGAGTAAAIGAVAGAAGGYMLGKSMSGNNNENNKQAASGVAQQEATNPATVQPESRTPWGLIGILAVLLVLGLVFFRKKANPGFPTPGNNHNIGDNKFNIPNFQRNANQNNVNQNNNMNSGAGFNADNSDRMPDGIESIYFLRQAKGMFLHIQSMNNPENVSEIAKYLTPELYSEVKEDMANNNSIADFTNLNCNLISSNMEENVLTASVNFSGLVSESSEQAPQPFVEIWNFIKPDITNNKWLVAGIQQVDTTKGQK